MLTMVPAGLDHPPPDGLGAVPEPVNVDVEGVEPLLAGHLCRGTVVADAGVVHEYVDGTEALAHSPDHCPDALRVGDVEVDGHCLAAGGGDILSHRLGAFAGAGRNGDACPHLGERPGEGLPEPRVAAGNDGDLACQVESIKHPHQTIPLLSRGRDAKGAPPGNRSL